MTVHDHAGAETASTRFVTRAPKLGLVGSFDGIRGIGVGMVLVGHALFAYVESWVTIVDSFFVLSGFLITTLLLQESRSTGGINLKRFYQRRAIRLLPSVWLFCAVWLVIAAIGTALGVEGLRFGEVLKDVGAALGYVYHVFFPNGLYLANPAQQGHRTMWHLWTLSVEEHFYLIIPGVTLLFVRWNRVRALGVLMAVGFVGITVARWFGYTGFFMDSQIVPGVRLAFLQRPDALMLGVALAVLNAHLDAERLARWRSVVLWAATAGLVVWLVMLNLSSGLVHKLGGPYLDYLPLDAADFTQAHMSSHLYWFRFGHSLGALGFATIVLALARVPEWWLARSWSWAPLQWIGRLSYTLYLWHALPYLLVMSATGGSDASLTVQLLRTPVLILTAFLVSMPVFYLVEQRVLGLKMRFASEPGGPDLRVGSNRGKAV